MTRCACSVLQAFQRPIIPFFHLCTVFRFSLCRFADAATPALCRVFQHPLAKAGFLCYLVHGERLYGGLVVDTSTLPQLGSFLCGCCCLWIVPKQCLIFYHESFITKKAPYSPVMDAAPSCANQIGEVFFEERRLRFATHIPISVS